MGKPGYIQKTFGMELSMTGVNCEQDWVFVNTDKAQRLYGNQGMHTVAIWIAALHPRAYEYLEQAPVLALAASFGGKADKRSDRAYIAMNLQPMIQRGEKLKTVLKAFRLAYPLRLISATAIRPGNWSIISKLSQHVPPSTISQSLPKDKKKHDAWLSALGLLEATLARRDADHPQNVEILRWAVSELGKTTRILDRRMMQDGSADHLADFLICNREEWNAKWSWDRLVREAAIWRDALANADIDRLKSGEYDKEVHYGQFPHEGAVEGGYTFHALRSLRALIVEGKAMRHCVASYHRDICSGRARIYSVRNGGKRVATLELKQWSDARASVQQLKGFGNAFPPKQDAAAAQEFAAQVTKTLRGGREL